MTAPVCKLTFGAATIDLNNQTDHFLHQTFVPPTIAKAPLIARGTSANKAGGKIIDNTPVERVLSVPLNVRGDSTGELRRKIQRIDFLLSAAGNDAYPLYLEYRPDNDVPEPLWGEFSANFRFEILSGRVSYDASYLVGARIATDLDATLDLVIKPQAVGREMWVCSAIGGVLEDVYGASDGASRGPIVAESVNNIFSNPVFGNESNYLQGWTATGSLTVAQLVDKRFALFGYFPVRLISNGASQTFTQTFTLAASTHIISAYVAMLDGSTPTTSDFQIHYNGSNRTTTITALGDGFFVAEASVTGSGAGAVTGITVFNGRSVVLCGMQVEQRAYRTQLAHGDMIGCSWTGTAHDSTTLRTASRVRLPVGNSTFSKAIGTICIAVRWHVANTHPNNMLLWSSANASGMRLFFNASDDTFRFTDGTTTLTSAAQTFVYGDVDVIHVVWSGTGGIALYVNGVLAASNVTYTMPSDTLIGSYIYIGTDQATASHALCTFMEFEVFQHALTATQVGNHNANIAAVANEGLRVGSIPWVFTVDGDEVIDNCDDGTRKNWAIVGGVPGTAPADTDYRIGLSGNTTRTMYIGHHIDDYVDWVPNQRRFYIEGQGTVEAGSSGGEYQGITGPTGLPRPSDSQYVNKAWTLEGNFHYVARVRNSAGTDTLTLAPFLQYNTGNINYPDVNVSLASAVYALVYLGRVTFKHSPALLDTEKLLTLQITFGTAATENFAFDFAQVLCGRLCVLSFAFSDIPGTGGAASTPSYIRLRGLYGAGNNMTYSLGVSASLDLLPGVLNTLTLAVGNSAGYTLTDTRTLTYVKVTPRYQLL